MVEPHIEKYARLSGWSGTECLSGGSTATPLLNYVLGRKKSNGEAECGSNGKGLLFKKVFAEPNSGEVERDIEIEQ